VFNEQYKISEEQQVVLRPKEEISSSSVQSPHDPDSAYRNKGEKKVKGYSVNITETCSDDNLNLITNVLVEKANSSDTIFVEPAIKATTEVTGQIIEKVYADGAYQSPANDGCCKNIDMVFTGIQGAEAKFDLEITPQGLLATDNQTGEQIVAVLVKKRKNSSEDKWSIKTPEGYFYFNQQTIRTAYMRRQMKSRPLEELHKRNNVEATIFQLGFPLRNNKSKYRGLIKQRIWAYCRCLWINLVRILNFTKQICQRTTKTMKLTAFSTLTSLYFDILVQVRSTLSRFFLTMQYLYKYSNLFILS
jgi:hypothetical protein